MESAETIIDLSTLKGTNAAYARIDELTGKIKAISHEGEPKGKAALIVVADNDDIDGYCVGGRARATLETISVLCSIVKNAPNDIDDKFDLCLKATVKFIHAALDIVEENASDEFMDGIEPFLKYLRFHFNLGG